MVRLFTSAKAALNIVALLLLCARCLNAEGNANAQILRKRSEEIQKGNICIADENIRLDTNFFIRKEASRITSGNHVCCSQTSLNIINSSLCVSHLTIVPLTGCPPLTAQHHSAATILSSTCQINPAAKSPLFLSTHASLSLANFSLITPQPAVLSFPLFSTPNNLLPDTHSPIPASFSISHSSFSSFVSLIQPFLFSPSSLSSPSPSPSPSLSSSPSSSSSSSSSSSFSSPSPSLSPSISSSSSPSPLHIHHQYHPHLQIHLNLHLSNTLFSNISSLQSPLSLPSLPSHSLNPFTSTTSSSSLSSTNTNTNSIPSFSLHSSLSIHSTIFLHTHNPIDGAILPNLNSPSTSLSAFNTSFLQQTRSSPNDPVIHEGTESERIRLGRLASFDKNSHRFEWCEWENTTGGRSHGGALNVNCANASIAITLCSFDKCISDGGSGGALYCAYLLKINNTKSNYTNCSAFHGGAACVDAPQSSSIWEFSENKVENCSITSWCATGWYFWLETLKSNGHFQFSKCKCITNYGGDSSGSLSLNFPPNIKPSLFLVDDCQFINNKLSSLSTKWGGAAIFFRDTYPWMSGTKFITFCFFDGNSAANGRGNDVFLNGSSITKSPFENCGSTTLTKRVWNAGTADNTEYNSWLPLIAKSITVANNGIDADTCGRMQQSPCATIEYALGCVAPFQDASLILLKSTFAPIQTLIFHAPNTSITGNGTDATTIASSHIPQPPNSHSQSSQSTSSFSSFSSSSSSTTSSSPDPSASSAHFQQTQGSLTVSALAISHNSTNAITPILFHLSENSPSLNLNTITITGTTSITIKTPLFFLTAGSLALNHTAITSLTLNSQSIFHLASLASPLTLNSSSITDITSTATPASCVLSSTTSPALSISLANCTITNINSEQLSQQTATNGGCISFASSAPANSFSVSDSTFSSCSVSEDTSSGGRGGALMIEYKDDSQVSESSFSMTNVMFSANKASVGRDVYFVCESFVASVNESSFTFMRSITQKDNSVVGHDRTEAFGNWNVDLFIFLDGYFSDTIYVDGTSGVEKAYCGLEKAPCLSVSYGMEHLKKTQNAKQEIILCTNSSVIGCVDMSVVSVKAKEEEIIGIECKSELNGSEEYILKSASLTEMKFIGIVVPSSFNRTITSVIGSSTQNGELFMKNCAMSVNGGKQNTIEFFLIKSTGKMVELDSITISDVKSLHSLFSFSLSSGSANEGDTEQKYKSKLLNCSMERLEIDSTAAVDGEAAMFGGSVGVGMVMNGSRIEGAVSEKNKEGGGLKIALGEGGYVALEESSLIGCVCENLGEEGKGGGIYLDCYSNEGGFQFSSISFSGCSATVGKNMFVKSNNLVNSVNTQRFAIVNTDYEDDENAFVGEDGKYGEMDLRVFLVSLKWVVVSVSIGGHDTLGCGIEIFPCESMKSGIDHIDRSDAEGERKVKAKDEGTIEDIYSFTDALVIDGEETKHKPIHFEGTIKGNSSPSSSSVISSTVSLSLFSLKLQIPSQFVPNINSLISSSGVLKLENCLFEIQSSTDIVQYSLITTTSGTCALKGCSLSGCSFTKSSFVIASSVLLENSNFSNIENTGSGEEGGVAKVTLQGNEELVIKSTRISSCSLSLSNGKGGFLYLDCQECSSKKPFLLENVSFANNKAAIGKNVFILGKDFNSSVTNDSFKFDYSSMINDGYLFVGSDGKHQEKDLFMFLIPFSSFEIFISSEGFDVARCGSEEEPCFTMWKGMENMEKGTGMKTIQVEESTIIRDSFNVSNYQIKKSVKMGEENEKAILNFEKAVGSQLEYFMVNNIHLELMNIQLQLTSGFDNSAKTIILNRGGDLVITGCAFHSEAGVNNGFDCVFVDAIGGSVEVNDLSIESCNVGNSIFTIHDVGVSCHFMTIRMESLNESRGCVLSIKKSEPGLKINGENEERINIEIVQSSISGVKRSDNGPNILQSKSEKKICLIVNASNITEDKAELSEKGGAIFFTLGASGSIKMIDSTIIQCICVNGKGGGVYLATKEREELNFTFVKMKFRNNEARVGNDIFIECFNITSQINETQFQFDLRENHYSRINAIYGRDECDYPSDTDLIDFVTIHQSDTIIVSSVNGSNERQCGTITLPCYSIEHGIVHLTSDIMSLIFVIEESEIRGELDLKEMSLSSKSRDLCEVEVKLEIKRTRETLATTNGAVSLLRMNFMFDSNFISSHESLILPEGGILEIINSSFTTKQSNEEGKARLANIPFHIIKMAKGELQLDGCAISNLILHKSALYLSSSLPSVVYSFDISNSTISHSLVEIIECGQLNMEKFHTENISIEGNEESLISCFSMKKTIQLTNCTIGGISSNKAKGKLMKFVDCIDVKMDNCIFDGSANERNEQYLNVKEEEMCRWDGSLVDVVKSSVMMKDTTISNSPDGGITMSGGELTVNDGRFENNNPSIEGYPSSRRNIICSDYGTLNVLSLKGGDGLERNTSLWMLNEGCSFEGIVSERDSSFFIPVLESVEAKEEANRMKLTFKGMLLVSCNLSFAVVKRKGDEKEIEKHDFDSNGFLSEREVEGSVGKDLISSCGNEIEVNAHILFGDAENPSSTHPFILKNKSESEPKGDEKIVEGGKEGKSFWLIIVIVIVCVVFVILLLVIVIILAIRWRKAKNENKDLREIVNDNIRKDPKAFEMMTMEMSPEEQWRRAEREAEKKNEERIKKRVYAKSLGHSESSEHLLSESGSTEYILGKDSDKIPDWALEKIEEDDDDEEVQKRTPSPSISSASTTDTDTTFVRVESPCPTTSSMSNLVDAMACSCPYEKLIVDLRDSMFMLLHGRNEKKDLGIGTLKEREVTGAQMLFWVANGALHSLEDEEDELPSLRNLDSHIVLFSEHMVICIALHSDCSSISTSSSSDDDDDYDSDSDISSIVTSNSDCSSVNGNGKSSLPPPSTAFEDEDNNRKECLRWKAPELLMNKKMGATEKSVAFSIGMMLWECLTLQIPFGEYEAEVAGQKIVDGEKPNKLGIEDSGVKNVVDACLSSEASKRPTLAELKKELIGLLPVGTFVVTITDAILLEESSEEHEDEGKSDKNEKERTLEVNEMKDMFNEE